jgi:hypothetical protein
MNESNLTAELYTVWLIQTMTQLDDGPEFNRLQEQFNKLMQQLDHLRNCYDLPSYETN